MRVEEFIQQCTHEAYAQPTADGHYNGMKKIIDEWIVPLQPKKVLDIGCGWGEALDYLATKGIDSLGLNVGMDYRKCKQEGKNVLEMDMHFMKDIPDNSFDLVYLRHVLEHSPIPLYVLSEIHRITKQWAIIVVPPDSIGVTGTNHYSVFSTPLWVRSMEYSAFEVEEKAEDQFVIEHWYKLKKI